MYSLNVFSRPRWFCGRNCFRTRPLMHCPFCFLASFSSIFPAEFWRYIAGSRGRRAIPTGVPLLNEHADHEIRNLTFERLRTLLRLPNIIFISAAYGSGVCNRLRVQRISLFLYCVTDTVYRLTFFWSVWIITRWIKTLTLEWQRKSIVRQINLEPHMNNSYTCSIRLLTIFQKEMNIPR